MADNKRYYWLKLPDDFFRQKEIKGLRKIAGGDTYTIIYLKMLLRSLKNSGVLYYDGIEADFISELAMDIDEEKENVAITVQFLLAKGLLEELNRDEYFLASCTKMIGSETAGAKRVRKHRENKKALQCNDDVTQTKHLVTKCNTDIDIEKELEKEIEKEEEIDEEINLKIINQILFFYQSICESLLVVKTLSEKRKKVIIESLEIYELEDFKKVFEIAESNSFLRGENKDGWSADFDWLIQAENMAKVLGGKYDAFKNTRTNSFNNFHQREYDYEELEKTLLTTSVN